MASIKYKDSMSLRQSLETPSTPDYQIASSKHEFEAMATTEILPITPSLEEGTANIPSHENCDGRHAEEENPTISISSTSKIAGQTVAPFLSKHIPDQYAPLGQITQKNTSSKYCYRHRPDLKCRRTANEPSMDNLQRVSGVHMRKYILLTPYRIWKHYHQPINRASLTSGRSFQPLLRNIEI